MADRGGVCPSPDAKEIGVSQWNGQEATGPADGSR